MSWLRISVVGGVNLDVLGQPDGPFQQHDSLIGSVRFVCGGVGHNIAAQAVRTGADVSLYTVFGNDRNADWLRQCCLKDGIRIDQAVTLNGTSPVYMAIHGSDGDMITAVNDMWLLDEFTPQLLYKMLPGINQSDVCVTDANLPAESLSYLAQHVNVPLICDPVSVVKSKRIIPVLSNLSAIKPNLLEAQAMTGADSPEKCTESLLISGVKMVFISLGKEGLYYADAGSSGHLRPVTVTTTPQTGAGDALTAGIASGIGLGYKAEDCARYGMDTVSRYLHLNT